MPPSDPPAPARFVSSTRDGVAPAPVRYAVRADDGRTVALDVQQIPGGYSATRTLAGDSLTTWARTEADALGAGLTLVARALAPAAVVAVARSGAPGGELAALRARVRLADTYRAAERALVQARADFDAHRGLRCIPALNAAERALKAARAAYDAGADAPDESAALCAEAARLREVLGDLLGDLEWDRRRDQVDWSAWATRVREALGEGGPDAR